MTITRKYVCDKNHLTVVIDHPNTHLSECPHCKNGIPCGARTDIISLEVEEHGNKEEVHTRRLSKRDGEGEPLIVKEADPMPLALPVKASTTCPPPPMKSFVKEPDPVALSVEAAPVDPNLAAFLTLREANA